MKCQNQSIGALRILQDMPRDDEKNAWGAFHRECGSAMYDQMARDEERRDFALYCDARQTFVRQPSTLREGLGLSAGSIAQAYLQGALSNFRDAEDDFASLASTASAASTVSFSMPAVNDWRGARVGTNTEVVGSAASMAAGPTFSWEREQGIEPGPFERGSQGSRAGLQRSHPYRKVHKACAPDKSKDLGDENLCDDSELTMGPGKPTNIRRSVK
mmetsp:Transcript_71032/g.104111  ORF Transcript_71032/g.104111 Transcript_71032/m.104111 type:complete len:216 (+) Transcript_71032:72-719(+)